MEPYELFDDAAERCGLRMQLVFRNWLGVIGERVKAVGELRGDDVKRLETMAFMGEDVAGLYAELARACELNVRDVEAMIDQAAEMGSREAEALARSAGRGYVPYAENIPLQAWVNGVKQVTAGSLRNLSNTTVAAFRSVDAAGNVLTQGARETYINVIDRAAEAVSLGMGSVHAAVRGSLRALADGGLRKVEYGSGNTRRMDSAVRMNVSDSVRGVYRGVQERIGE